MENKNGKLDIENKKNKISVKKKIEEGELS
jgi:hypothetical protein